MGTPSYPYLFDVWRTESPGTAHDGDFRWRLKGANHKIVAASTEGYENGRDMVKSVRKYITRGDPLMENAFDRALARAGLDARGRVRTK